MSPWKVILATIVIFAAGVITGGVLVNRVQRPERPRPLPPFAGRPQPEMMPTPWFVRREFLDRMDRHLDLSRDQYERIAAILQHSQERTRKIMRSIGPEIQDELRQVRREIRAELTPEQVKKFEEFQPQFRGPPRRPGPNENPDMRRGPPPRDPPPRDPPLNARPDTNTP